MQQNGTNIENTSTDFNKIHQKLPPTSENEQKHCLIFLDITTKNNYFLGYNI
jgi:hypothetical protein